MPSVHETAYPRLKNSFAPRGLAEYTPSADELALARRAGRTPAACLAFLVLHKVFQRLGYFVPLADVPPQIVEHVARATGLPLPHDAFAGYDRSGSRRRHLRMIREALGVSPFSPGGRRALVRAIGEAALTKNELADLVNVGLEELTRRRFELPAFDTLERAARRIRATVARAYVALVSGRLDAGDRGRIDALLLADPVTRRTPWNALKQEPGSPTLSHLRRLVERIHWLSALALDPGVLAGVPDVKVKHFAAEARTLDAARMQQLEPRKRYTLAAALLSVQSSAARDDLAEMFVKRMTAVHHKADEALAAYRAEHQHRTDALVATLREVVVAFREEGTAEDRLARIGSALGGRADELLADCDAHAEHAGTNHNAFLWDAYRGHRATLFRILHTLKLRSTSQDRGLELSLAFLRDRERSNGDWLDVSRLRPDLDLDWIPDAWWRLVTGQRSREVVPNRVDRRRFEACAFSQMMWELKSGDLAVEGSDRFADYREQLVGWEEYERLVGRYAEIAGLPAEGAAFAGHLRGWLSGVAAATDRAFPDNEAVRIEDGVPTIRKPEKRPVPEGLRAFEELVAERLEPVNILEILTDTEHWLHWTQFFGPISGYETKLEDPTTRHLAAVFCYGCHLGPTQTARSLREVDRRNVAWVNLRHVTEEKLDRAIQLVVNAYSRFALPKVWGTGRSASADGTKWSLYEQNLLSEYHVRYGGYGGIGHYHVSDTYVALFSSFIPCGVWEAVHILDGLLKNESEIRPDTLHADTQGQSAPVFGLSYLLGIKLMPRIRNWRNLEFHRPAKGETYEHIDGPVRRDGRPPRPGAPGRPGAGDRRGAAGGLRARRAAAGDPRPGDGRRAAGAARDGALPLLASPGDVERRARRGALRGMAGKHGLDPRAAARNAARAGGGARRRRPDRRREAPRRAARAEPGRLWAGVGVPAASAARTREEGADVAHASGLVPGRVLRGAGAPVAPRDGAPLLLAEGGDADDRHPGGHVPDARAQLGRGRRVYPAIGRALRCFSVSTSAARQLASRASACTCALISRRLGKRACEPAWQ